MKIPPDPERYRQLQDPVFIQKGECRDLNRAVARVKQSLITCYLLQAARVQQVKGWREPLFKIHSKKAFIEAI